MNPELGADKLTAILTDQAQIPKLTPSHVWKFAVLIFSIQQMTATYSHYVIKFGSSG